MYSKIKIYFYMDSVKGGKNVNDLDFIYYYSKTFIF